MFSSLKIPDLGSSSYFHFFFFFVASNIKVLSHVPGGKKQDIFIITETIFLHNPLKLQKFSSMFFSSTIKTETLRPLPPSEAALADPGSALQLEEPREMWDQKRL